MTHDLPRLGRSGDRSAGHRRRAEREPALGPVLGIEGGAAGGGYGRVLPMEAIDPYVTGDVLAMPGLPADPAAAHVDVDDDGDGLL